MGHEKTDILPKSYSVHFISLMSHQLTELGLGFFISIQSNKRMELHNCRTSLFRIFTTLNKLQLFVSKQSRSKTACTFRWQDCFPVSSIYDTSPSGSPMSHPVSVNNATQTEMLSLITTDRCYTGFSLFCQQEFKSAVVIYPRLMESFIERSSTRIISPCHLFLLPKKASGDSAVKSTTVL